jgi:hypothetical protein
MTALERAFQLARSGEVAALPEIVGALRREGGIVTLAKNRPFLGEFAPTSSPLTA